MTAARMARRPPESSRQTPMAAAALEIKSVLVKDPVMVMEMVVTRVLKIVRVTGMYLVISVVLVRGVDV